MKKIIILSVLVAGVFFANAQTDKQGEVIIYTDPVIDNLLQLHIAYNDAFPVMPGYRIQIFFESGNQALNNAEEVKNKFVEKFNSTKAYLQFGAPYYRVRVGDFRTRLEAEKFLSKINRKYPNAWIIKDEINFPVLPKYNQK